MRRVLVAVAFATLILPAGADEMRIPLPMPAPIASEEIHNVLFHKVKQHDLCRRGIYWRSKKHRRYCSARGGGYGVGGIAGGGGGGYSAWAATELGTSGRTSGGGAFVVSGGGGGGVGVGGGGGGGFPPDHTPTVSGPIVGSGFPAFLIAGGLFLFWKKRRDRNGYHT